MELFMEYARAFLCGGVLCLIGQLLIDKTPYTTLFRSQNPPDPRENPGNLCRFRGGAGGIGPV